MSVPSVPGTVLPDGAQWERLVHGYPVISISIPTGLEITPAWRLFVTVDLDKRCFWGGIGAGYGRPDSGSRRYTGRGWRQQLVDDAVAFLTSILAPCSHPRTVRGNNAPRRYGSWRTEICMACGAFRTHGHDAARSNMSEWKPAADYAAATAKDDDE